jgi:hypothetical protein
MSSLRHKRSVRCGRTLNGQMPQKHPLCYGLPYRWFRSVRRSSHRSERIRTTASRTYTLSLIDRLSARSIAHSPRLHGQSSLCRFEVLRSERLSQLRHHEAVHRKTLDNLTVTTSHPRYHRHIMVHLSQSLWAHGAQKITVTEMRESGPAVGLFAACSDCIDPRRRGPHHHDIAVRHQRITLYDIGLR